MPALCAALIAHPAQTPLHTTCYQALWNLAYWTTLAAEAAAAHLHFPTIESHLFARDPHVLPPLLGLLQCATRASESLREQLSTDDLLTQLLHVVALTTRGEGRVEVVEGSLRGAVVQGS